MDSEKRITERFVNIWDKKNKRSLKAFINRLKPDDSITNHKSELDEIYTANRIIAEEEINEYVRMWGIISKDVDEAFAKYELKGEKYYFIVIRPKDETVDLTTFRHILHRIFVSKQYSDFTVSFEQTDLTGNNLGFGVHANIICKTTLEGYCHIRRDLERKLKPLIEKGMDTSHGIYIKHTKNPDELIENYLIQYKSRDGHKECSREMDTLWRKKVGIPHIFTSETLTALPSFGSSQMNHDPEDHDVHSETIIVNDLHSNNESLPACGSSERLASSPSVRVCTMADVRNSPCGDISHPLRSGPVCRATRVPPSAVKRDEIPELSSDDHIFYYTAEGHIACEWRDPNCLKALNSSKRMERIYA